MTTTGRMVKIESRIEIINTFLRKMWRSAYGCTDILIVLESGLKGYYDRVQEELTRGTRLKRHQETGYKEGEIKRVIEKST